MVTRWRYPLCLLAGLLLPLAFAPFGQFWIAPLSYGALFYFWRGVTPGAALRMGVAYGIGSFGAGTYWTYIAVHDFGGAPLVFAALVSFALVLGMALFIGAAGYTAARWFKTTGAVAWLGTLPALYLIVDWLRGWLFTGFGWLAPGYSQTGSWLMGYASLTGVLGMSWGVLVLAGAAVTLVLGVTRERVAAAVAIAAVSTIGFAAATVQWTEPKGRELNVALVQGAIQQDDKWRPEMLPAMRRLYFGLTQDHPDADIIVWPEAAIPDFAENNERLLADVQAWSKQHGAAVLLGILRLPPKGSPPNATNQNVLLALTEPRGTYVKRHLVPFGEYYPVPGFMRNWLRLLKLPYTDGVPGPKSPAPLEVAGERIGVMICYEDVFGAEQRHYLPDATLLVNVSNDAWFGDSIAPHQHLQIAQVRAAEAGRWMLRATNTGVTAVIDPLGRVRSTAPQFEATVLTHTVQGYTGMTPYARVGNYPMIVAALAVLLASFPPIATRLRRTRVE